MIEFITEHWMEISGVIAAVIILAERIARLTPTETDNMVLKTVRRVAVILGIQVPDNPGEPKDDEPGA